VHTRQETVLRYFVRLEAKGVIHRLKQRLLLLQSRPALGAHLEMLGKAAFEFAARVAPIDQGVSVFVAFHRSFSASRFRVCAGETSPCRRHLKQFCHFFERMAAYCREHKDQPRLFRQRISRFPMRKQTA
jgi:hypothetical protein